MRNILATAGSGIVLRLLLSFFICSVSPVDARDVGDINALKVALIFNIIKYTHWPDSALQSASHIHVCLPGDDPFKGYLSGLERQSAHGLRLKVVTGLKPEALANCQVIYIGHLPVAQQGQWLSRRAQLPVLTIGEKSQQLPGLDVWLLQRGAQLGYGLDLQTSAARGLRFVEKLQTLTQEKIANG